MNKKIGVLILLVAFIITFASAEIFLAQQPNELYTLGETMELELGTDGETGWITMDLMCGNLSKMLYFHYLTEQDTSTLISVPLSKDFLRSMSGECNLNLRFKDQEKQSMAFTIDDKINIDITFNEKAIKPNTTIVFSGTTSKSSGQKVEGFAEVSFEDLSLEMIVPIENNKFSGELFVPENVASGSYELSVFAYEKDENEEITNNGLSNFTMTILPESTTLVIEAPSDVNPDGDLEFKAMLYDQAGQTMDGFSTAFKLMTPEDEKVLEILSETGTPNYYKLRKNAPKGYWNLSAESEGITEIIQIYVNENEEAQFILINDTLVITNVGNVPYDTFVEITIKSTGKVDISEEIEEPVEEETTEEIEEPVEEEQTEETEQLELAELTEVKYLNLSLGASVEFELYAPDGQYEINIKDGEQELVQTTPLTGKTIAIKDARGFGLSFFNKNFIAWFFLILVLGMFIFITSRKIIKKKQILFFNKLNFKKKIQEPAYKGGVVKVTPAINRNKTQIDSEKQQSKGFIESEHHDIQIGNATAKHSLVLDGSKQNASVIALKIKNYDKLKNTPSNAQATISQAIKSISENHGRIYKAEDYIIGIFAPAVTRTFDNALSAIKTANYISQKLRQYNLQYTQKIKFGIGVNQGEIIAKKQDNKLLFTPYGTSLSSAKKIAEIADNDVLLSQTINKAIGSKARTIMNPEKFGIKTYSVKEIIDREQNQEFISKFLKRNELKKLDDFKG